MSSHKQAKHISLTDIRHSSVLSMGEEQQSNEATQQRSGSAGSDAELTELAVPPPVEEDDGIRDTYEKEEQRAKATSSDLRGAGQGDGELTENAVPSPILYRGPSDEEAGSATPTGFPRYQGLPDSQNSSLTGVSEEEKQRLTNTSSIYVDFCTISWLVFFAILGTLARLGVEAISTYPNAPFPSPVLWANLGGSLLLGFLLEDRRFFRYGVEERAGVQTPIPEIDRGKKILPLYIGLATGFCGSFTSFSTFITDAFLALSNGLNSPSPTAPFHVSQSPIPARNGGYSFMATAGILIIQTAVSVGSLKAGAQMALASQSILPSIPAAFLHRVLDPLSIPLGWGCWLGAALLTVWPPYDDWRYRATFAMVFAPPGAVLRYYLSKHLNACIPAFPLGTFIVNIFGTIVEGICMDLQHSSVIIAKTTGGNAVPCAILEGVMSGFCGCTTTVSTWVAELNGLRWRHAWIYGLASVGIALAFQVVIMGSMIWTVGYEK